MTDRTAYHLNLCDCPAGQRAAAAHVVSGDVYPSQDAPEHLVSANVERNNVRAIPVL